MKFQLLIKGKMGKTKYGFKTLRYIYYADKCLNANNCWHFNIYEQDTFHAQLKSISLWSEEKQRLHHLLRFLGAYEAQTL